MKNLFAKWTVKSVFLLSALTVSATAHAQSATYTAEAPAYAVAVSNGLADASTTITYNDTAASDASRITGVIYIIGDESGGGQDFVVRANASYTLELSVPTLPYGESCQPAFSTGSASFGAVGELLVSIGDTSITFNDLGFNATNSGDVTAAIACDNVANSATITFTSSLTETAVETYSFALGFLPDGARSADGSDYGADNEPPAGDYSLGLTATLAVS